MLMTALDLLRDEPGADRGARSARASRPSSAAAPATTASSTPCRPPRPSCAKVEPTSRAEGHHETPRAVRHARGPAPVGDGRRRPGPDQDRRDQLVQRHRRAVHRPLQAGGRDGGRGGQRQGRRARPQGRGDLPRRQGPAGRGGQARAGAGDGREGRAGVRHVPVERGAGGVRLGEAEQDAVRRRRAAHRGDHLVEGPRPRRPRAAQHLRAGPDAGREAGQAAST